MYWYLLILGILFILMVYINKERHEGFASRDTFGHLSLVEMIAQLRSPPSPTEAAPNAFGSNILHKKQPYYIDSCNYDPTSKLLDDINFCRTYAAQNPVNPFADTRFNSSCGICMTQGTVLLNQAPFSISATTNGTGVVVYKEDKDFSINERTQAVPSSHSAYCEPLLINSNLIPTTAHVNNITGLVINSDQYRDTLAYLNNMKYITFNDVTSCAASISKSIQCTFSNTVIASMRFVSGHFNDETCEAGSNLVDMDTNPTPENCIGQQSCTFSSNLPAGYRQWYLTAECAVQEEAIPPGLPGMFLLSSSSSSSSTPSSSFSTYPYYWTVPYGANAKQQITVYGSCTLTQDKQVTIESYTNASFDLYLHTLKQYTQTNTGSTPSFNAPTTVFALYKGSNTIRLDISSPNTMNGIYFAIKDLSGNVVCSLDTTWVYSQYRSKVAFASPIPSPIPSPSATPPSLSLPPINGIALTLTPVSGTQSVSWTSFASSPDGTTIYAVAYYYMYKSTNRGAAWTLQSVNDTTGITDRRYYRMCMSSDASYRLLSTYGGPLFVYRSGRWNIATGIPTYGAVTCTPDASVMYVACEGAGVYKSINYGVNWTLLLPGVDPTNYVTRGWRSISCSSSGRYIVLVAYNSGVYVSSDSGSSWVKINLDTRLQWQSSTCSADGKHMSVLHNGGELFISNDYGVSWARSIATPVITTGEISVCCSQDGMNYIITLSSGLLVSRDGGNNWIYQSTTFPVNGSSTLSADGSLGIIGSPSTGQLYVVTFTGGSGSGSGAGSAAGSAAGAAAGAAAGSGAAAGAAAGSGSGSGAGAAGGAAAGAAAGSGSGSGAGAAGGAAAGAGAGAGAGPSPPLARANPSYTRQNTYYQNLAVNRGVNTYTIGNPYSSDPHGNSDMGFSGTLQECKDACTYQPSCLGVSRAKGLDPNASQFRCWLKFALDDPIQNDSSIETYVKDV